jgi:hypothetical protein
MVNKLYKDLRARKAEEHGKKRGKAFNATEDVSTKSAPSSISHVSFDDQVCQEIAQLSKDVKSKNSAL